MGAPQLIVPGTASGTAPVGGTGTSSPSTIPRWTGPSTLGDSGLIDNGTAIYTTTRNFGIGTASPNAILSVYNASTPTISLWNSSNFTRFSTNTNDCFVDVGLGGTAGALIFRRSSSATESARIDSSGRLIVGSSTSPGLSTGFITAVGASSSYLATFKTAATAGGCLLGSGADPVELWRTSGTFGAETYTKILSADTSNNLILNTANTGATIQAAGTSQGLKLQGTAGTNNTDPNVLDFYADGGTANSGGVTWTPTLKFGGNTTGITYNTQMGRYTRIGNMVFATCYVRLTNKGSATGAATIDGLPTSANLAGLYAAGTIGFISAITSTGTMEAYITPNSSQITLRQVDIAGTNAATTDVNFANTSEIIISIAYSVN